MFQGIATKKILTWFACLAILFGALAPTVAQVHQARVGDPLLDICSATGIGADAPAKSGPGTLAKQHCPFCTLQLPDLAPAPASCGSVLVTELPAGPPALFLLAPRTLHAWAHANPRAPPQRS